MEIAASFLMQNISVTLVSWCTISWNPTAWAVLTATHRKVILWCLIHTLFMAIAIIPFSTTSILNKYSHNTENTHRYKPQLWSCCLQSRDAVGRLQHWTAPMGTGAVTSGSPLAAPDLSTQTLYRETDRRRHFDSLRTLTKHLDETQEITWTKSNKITGCLPNILMSYTHSHT